MEKIPGRDAGARLIPSARRKPHVLGWRDEVTLTYLSSVPLRKQSFYKTNIKQNKTKQTFFPKRLFNSLLKAVVSKQPKVVNN